MTSNFRKDDPILGTVDLDDAYLTDASLLDYFVGNRIFTAGAAAFGTNGQSNTLSRSSPVQVGSLTTWKAVSGGFAHYHATKTDGTLWAWGYNDVGNLGIGNTVARSSPVQVGLLTNWKSIGARAGTSNCGAIKTDGTLWMWGVGTSGQLGLGNATSRSSPVQVGSLTNWKQLAVGNGQTLCVKTDGTLWAWGSGQNGALGLGDVIARSSPVQVGSLTNWKQPFIEGGSTFCIKTDGTLWAWGDNALYGQLGQGDAISRSSPVQVGSLTNWKQVNSDGDSVACIKTDGTLWTWGLNGNGQLGQGDAISRSSPVQVGSLTNWKQVVSGDRNFMCVKTDGTLWAWGLNTSGRLGFGDTLSRSSPVQVGSLTNWKQVGGTLAAITFADFS